MTTSPVVYDVAAATRRAMALHGYPEDAAIIPFSVTENPTYRVEAPGFDAVVLRIYHPGVRPRREIESELAWLSALQRDTDIRVPNVFPTADGSSVLEVGTSGAPMFAAVFELVPGREMADDDLPSMMTRLGRLTAQLHTHARSWQRPAWFDRPVWNVDTTIGDSPHWGPWQASVFDPDERQQLERLAEALRGRLRTFGDGPDRFGLVHADLRMANVLFDGSEITVIDFDDSGFSWYLYDLAATFTFCEDRSDLDALVAAWVDSYRTVAPLPETDASEIPTFIMLRRLLVCAFAGYRSDTDLVAEMHAGGYSTITCQLADQYLSRFT